MTPALFACVAANEAERASPGVTINDVQMMGASGRLFISGTSEELEAARHAVISVLNAVEGRST